MMVSRGGLVYWWLLWTGSTLAAVDHPEVRGEDPHPQHVDDGMCIPIKCDAGSPPKQCTELCAQRHYLPVCQPPGDFCLCQRLDAWGDVTLVSPDEVLDQPVDTTADDDDFSIFAFILPIADYFQQDEEVIVQEPYIVNVHEAERLSWLFQCTLSGLLLLMVSLIVYELIMCRAQANRTKWELLVP